MGKQEYIAYTLTGPKPSPLRPHSHTPPINTSHAHAARSIFLGSSRYSLTLTVGFILTVSDHSCAACYRTARTKEGDSFPTVQETVVVGEGDNHDRADDDLAVDDNRAILNRVHACWELLGCVVSNTISRTSMRSRDRNTP